MNLKKWKGTDE